MARSVTVLAREDARLALAGSLGQMVRAVGPSLGPCGRSVIAEQGEAMPALLGDGWSIAQATAGGSGIATLGARLLKETLFEIERDVGDGTGSAAVLIAELVRASLQATAAGIDAGGLSVELTRLGRQALDAIEHQRIPADKRLLKMVARSASRDSAIADRIATAFVELGPEGLMEVAAGSGRDIEITGTIGMSFDASLVSAELAADRAGAAVRLANPSFLVADQEIIDFGRLAAVLDGFVAAGKSLVIVARDVTGPARHALVRNRQNGVHVIAVKVRDVLQRGFAALEDVAIVTGAELISELRGTTLSSLRPAMLGRGGEFVLVDGQARIVAPQGDARAIELRRGELRRAIARERYLSYDRELLQRRLARLGGEHRQVRVGGTTQPEQSGRLVAAKRCVAVLRLAAREGVVPGGGAVLAHAARDLTNSSRESVEGRAAVRILRAGLRAVPAQLLSNAGLEAAEWLGRIDAAESPRIGVDLVSRRCVDMVDAGIVDPLPVVREVVRRGLSVATTILRTGALVG